MSAPSSFVDVLKSTRRVHTVYQTEIAECGIACLAMISSYHGRDESLSSLRSRFGSSLRGADLASLIGFASRVGLDCRALRVDIPHLVDLPLPCILHWNLSHYVVLEEIRPDGSAVVHDPATGMRVVGSKEINECFTGIAVEVSKSSSFEHKPKGPSVAFRSLIGPILGFAPTLRTLIVLSLLLQSLMMLSPLLLQWTIDSVVVTSDFDIVPVLAVGFLLVTLLQVSVSYVRGWSAAYLASTLSLQWVSSIFAHLLKLPVAYFEKRSIGDVVSRIGSARSIQTTVSSGFVEGSVDGVMAISIAAIMIFYSWKLSLICFVAVTLYILVRVVMLRRVRAATEQMIAASARQQTNVLESIRGVQAIRIFSKEALRSAAQFNLATRAASAEFGLARQNLLFVTCNQLIFGVEKVLVISVGAMLALEGSLTAGMLIAFIAYKDLFATRISTLVDKLFELALVRVHGERLSDIVHHPPEDHAGHQVDSTAQVKYEDGDRLELQVDVSFRYAEGDPWVLRDCKFSISQGESIAITGPSGCGKSTLVKLLVGVLAPTEGSIKLNGTDIREVGLHRYREMIGAVMQNDDLFSGSIEDNISFFDPGCDSARVREAARHAAIDREIESLPMGYKSLVGDMGSVLSGGQKQRVLLARALFRSPRLLVLDEATSHLDVTNEKRVNTAIQGVRATKVFVAHRAETVASADRVIALDRGAVVHDVLCPRSPDAFDAPSIVHAAVAAEVGD